MDKNTILVTSTLACVLFTAGVASAWPPPPGHGSGKRAEEAAAAAVEMWDPKKAHAAIAAKAEDT